jgi:PAS domain S-box-containing protein
MHLENPGANSQPESSGKQGSLDPRLSVVLRVELLALTVRYLVYFVLVSSYVVGVVPHYFPNLPAVTIAVILHNSFTHWVLYSRRYHLFSTPLNFAIHLINISLIVLLTGAEESPLSALYIFFIIGYCAYAPHFLNTFLVTFICMASYAFVILAHWSVAGINVAYTTVTISLSGIVAAGWFMGTLGELLQRIELDSMRRAQALASSEATLRAILDNTADPIVVYGENEFVEDVNRRACEFLGVRREQLNGQRFRTFLFDDGSLPNKFASLRARGEYRGEVLVNTADGEERSVVLLVRSFLRGNKRLFVAMLHDITEQKNLQEASRVANLRLEQVNRELKQVNDLRTEFFTIVSQRLRSPLSAILGYTDLLLHEELGQLAPEQRKALQSCRRSVLRVFSLVDEAFEVGSGHNGQGTAKAAESETASLRPQ